MNARRAARAIADDLRAARPLNAAALHRIARHQARALANESGRAVLDAAIELSADERFAFRIAAFLLVMRHAPSLAAIRARDLEALAAHLSDWSDVDTFCLVSGRAWREGQVSDAFFRKWARSENRWLRRAAVVSTVPLNVKAQGGTGDAPRTLAICDLLAEDRDDMIIKAVSWSLRALSVHDPGAVRAFVAANRGRLAPRVIREVENKLRTGLKNPKRAAVAPARLKAARRARRRASD